jgi:hypothetical protein
VKDQIIKKARITQDRPRSTLQECSQNVSPEGLIALPGYEAPRRIIHRQRKLSDSSTLFDFE